MREDVDEVDVIVHEDTEEHVVIVFADFGKAVDIWGNVDTL